MPNHRINTDVASSGAPATPVMRIDVAPYKASQNPPNSKQGLRYNAYTAIQRQKHNLESSPIHSLLYAG